MKEFKAYIQQFGNLNEQHLDLIISKASTLDLTKDTYFSEAGRVPGRVGFIMEGIVRGCYYSNEGVDTTRCFISENNLVVDYIHFEANTPSSEYLQACTNCQLLVFSKQDWNDLSRIIGGWDSIHSKMVKLCMYEKSRKGPVISQDATARYLEFMENFPSLVNRIPLSYIASYLGVTQQSLSRIRKNIR